MGIPQQTFPEKFLFSYGEVSPFYHHKTDTKVYQGGLKKLRNAYVTRQGSVRRRPGTKRFQYHKVHTEQEKTAAHDVKTFNYRSPSGKNYLMLFKNKKEGNPINIYLLEKGAQGYSPVIFRPTVYLNALDAVHTLVGSNENTNENYPRLNTGGDASNGYDLDNIQDLSISQFQNLIAVAHNKYQPHFIIEATDGAFFFIKSLPDLALFGNSNKIDPITGKADSEFYFKRMFEAYPYTYLPLDLILLPGQQGDPFKTGESFVTEETGGEFPDVTQSAFNVTPTMLNNNAVVSDIERRGAPFENALLMVPDVIGDLDLTKPLNQQLEGVSVKYSFIQLKSSAPSAKKLGETLELDYLNILRKATLAPDMSSPLVANKQIAFDESLIYRFKQNFTEDGTTRYYGIPSVGHYWNTPKGRRLRGVCYVSSWDDGDYPSTCYFHDRRLVLGSTRKDPQKIWLSEVNNFSRFTDADITMIGIKAQQDDSPYEAVPSADLGFNIKSMASMEQFFILTTDRVFTTPSTVLSRARYRPDFRNPSSNLRPVILENKLYYVTSDKSKLFNTYYDRSFQKYVTDDVSSFSDHLFKIGELKTAGTDSGRGLINIGIGNEFLTFSHIKDESLEVSGWSRNSVNHPEGFQLVDVHSAILEDREVFLFVYFNGEDLVISTLDYADSETGYTLDNYLDERVDFEWAEDDDAVYRLNKRGFGYETFVLIVNGHYEGEYTKSTINSHHFTEGDKVTIGIPFETIIAPLDPSLRTREGSSTALDKRIKHLLITLTDSSTFKIGRFYHHYDNSKPHLKVEYNPGTVVSSDLEFTIDGPYPFGLSGITYRMEVVS